MPEINGVSVPFLPAGGVDGLSRKPSQTLKGTGSVPFEDVFREELGKVKFSGHAKTRMTGRDIALSDTEMTRLESAVDKATEKGAKESLVLYPDKAFIVSVPNRTVITAMDRQQLDNGVITNIDSAVMA